MRSIALTKTLLSTFIGGSFLSKSVPRWKYPLPTKKIVINYLHMWNQKVHMKIQILQRQCLETWMENQLVIGNDISCYSESCKPDQCANLVIKAWSTKHWWMWENQKCLWPNYPVCVSFPLQPLIVKPEQQFRSFYRNHSKSWNWLKQTKLLFPLFSCTHFFLQKAFIICWDIKKSVILIPTKNDFPRKLGYLDKKKL